ncbi:MAG: hypothetical protein HUK25_09395 [Treponema sp.]|nr:hypothetical protein [Treponema sp.]
MSLGATVAGFAMAGTAGYCAEKLVTGEPGTVEGMVGAAASGAAGAMMGAVFSEVAPKITSSMSNIASKVSQSTQKEPYSNLPESSNVGPGKPFTQAQKKAIINENMNRNGGIVRSDGDGRVLTKPTKNMKSVTPSPDEWQIDHIYPKSLGDSNSNSNAQVLSRDENIYKSNKVE